MPPWLWATALFAYAFLYVPLLIVVVYSFNDSRLNAEWVGFTLDWYRKLRRRRHAGRRRQFAADRRHGQRGVDRARNHGGRGDAPLQAHRAAGARADADRDSRDSDGRQSADLLRAAELHAGPRIGGAGAHRVLHRLRRNRRPRPAGRHGRGADRGGARLRCVARQRVPVRDAATDHAGRHRRRADGVHIVDRRLRHHVLHRRGRHRDAAATDLLDDQDRRDARGQCRVNAADAADVAADRRCRQTVAHPPPLRPGNLTMTTFRSPVALAAVLAALFAFAPLAAARDQLHLYNWNNYIAPETIKRFEGVCQCEVVQTYYSDNEELLAKLAAGAKGYDVLVPTSNAVQALIRGGQLKPFDKTALPNLKNVDPAYLNTPFDPNNQYSVPYAMSTTIIGYNDEKMKELGLPTDTWAVIFDPKYLEKVKGRVTVLDSANELFAAAQKYLGYSANDVDPKHWDEAAPDQEGEAVLGCIQRVVVHQGTDRRQHLARARLFERHLPGEPRRAGGRAEVPHPAGRTQGRRGAGRRQHGHPQVRAAARPRAALHQLHARGPQLGRAHEPDRLRQPQCGRAEIHQARVDQAARGVPAEGIAGKARAAEGRDGHAAPPAQQAMDRDQGQQIKSLHKPAAAPRSANAASRAMIAAWTRRRHRRACARGCRTCSRRCMASRSSMRRSSRFIPGCRRRHRSSCSISGRRAGSATTRC